MRKPEITAIEMLVLAVGQLRSERPNEFVTDPALSDLVLAHKIKDYYQHRLMLMALKGGPPLSTFRVKLAQWLNGDRRLSATEEGMAWMLPRFYQQDLQVEELYGRPGLTASYAELNTLVHRLDWHKSDHAREFELKPEFWYSYKKSGNFWFTIALDQTTVPVMWSSVYKTDLFHMLRAWMDRESITVSAPASGIQLMGYDPSWGHIQFRNPVVTNIGPAKTQMSGLPRA
jgi:hypothetical protein